MLGLNNVVVVVLLLLLLIKKNLWSSSLPKFVAKFGLLLFVAKNYGNHASRMECFDF